MIFIYKNNTLFIRFEKFDNFEKNAQNSQIEKTLRVRKK
jgi:hypothetical protein